MQFLRSARAVAAAFCCMVFYLKSFFEMEINSQLIIDRLSQRLDLDRVYLVKYEFLKQEYHHLLLALKPVSGLSHKVLKPIVELCLMDQENISFEIVPTGEMLNKIKTGSLYYSYASLAEHIIYLDSKKHSQPLKAKELKSILEISQEYYQKMRRFRLIFSGELKPLLHKEIFREPFLCCTRAWKTIYGCCRS